LHEPEWRDIASNIINKTAARAWLLDIDFILFDGHLYTPATSPLLPALVEALLIGGRVNNLNYLAFGFHTPPMT
jgi:hypothetical protein